MTKESSVNVADSQQEHVIANSAVVMLCVKSLIATNQVRAGLTTQVAYRIDHGDPRGSCGTRQIHGGQGPEI